MYIKKLRDRSGNFSERGIGKGLLNAFPSVAVVKLNNCHDSLIYLRIESHTGLRLDEMKCAQENKTHPGCFDY
jgi:hypothetical protein